MLWLVLTGCLLLLVYGETGEVSPQQVPGPTMLPPSNTALGVPSQDNATIPGGYTQPFQGGHY